MNIIFGNYGNNTVAVLQWAFEQGLQNVVVLDVATGWAAEGWEARVAEGQALARNYGFQAQTIAPPQSLPAQIIDRGQFPSVKFSWCAHFVKGLAFSAWADQADALGEATVIMGSRRADSPARGELAEVDEANPHFGGRRVWYPLVLMTDTERDALIQRSGLPRLDYRSRECLPCVYMPISDQHHMSALDQARLTTIESRIGREFSMQSFIAERDLSQIEGIDMGCGSNYACGE